MKRRMVNRIILLSAILSLVFSGCGGGGPQGSIDSVDVALVKARQDRASERLNQMMVQSKMVRSADPNADYVIGPEDLLEIEVFQADDLKKEVRVNYNGFIGLPVVGQINAKGLTPAQLEKVLSQALEKYLNEPLVTVHVKEYKSHKVAVTGAVTKPGVYSIVGQKYLIDLLFMAEGLKDAGKSCYVFRPVNRNDANSSNTETIIVDIQELLDKGDRTLNIPVFGGDIVHVPHGGSFYVDGAVKKRGMYRLAGKTSVVQAIAMSEGFSFTADSSDIRILRDTGRGEREVIAIDYEKAKYDTKNDLQIQDNDIVLVGRSGLKMFVEGFFTMVRGAVSIGSSGSNLAIQPPVVINQ